jgi:hypothetical protein
VSTSWQPFRESIRTTLGRTVGIALVVGGAVALGVGRLDVWPVAAGLMLWISFGGHWIELWFLNWLRPRLAPTRLVQTATRVVVWFLGGVVLGYAIAACMRLSPLTRGLAPWPWWAAGVGFIAVELLAHLVLALRRRPNFYGGDG